MASGKCFGRVECGIGDIPLNLEIRPLVVVRFPVRLGK